MVDVSASLALLALAAVALGEWIHARHVDAASVLAFGPSGRPRRWTRVAPAVRTLSAALFVWGSATLALSPSSTITIDRTTSERLLVLMDVSPSMYLEDAGSTEPVTRLSRARSTLRAILDRTAPEVPISVGAFYNELKPIVVDTTDRNILENVCNRLPLTQAFTGQRAKTNLTGSLAAAFEMIEPWPLKSTTIVLLTDGDSVPSKGLPATPRSVSDLVVLGFGSNVGRLIDGHSSCQQIADLTALAHRTDGTYLDCNAADPPPELLRRLAGGGGSDPRYAKTRERMARLAIVTSSLLLAALWILLPWLGARRPTAPWRVLADRRGQGQP